MSEQIAWKKPSDVMKIHRRRKSVSQKRITADADKRTDVIYKSPSKSVKRKNPFHKDSPHPNAIKRIKESKDCHGLGDGTLDDPLKCKLFGFLDSAESPEVTPKTVPSKENLEDNTPIQTKDNRRGAGLDSSTLRRVKPQQITSVDIGATEEKNPCSYLPNDWALKTKLRVVSSHPLGWCVQLKSADEAAAVTGFTQAQPVAVTTSTDEKQAFHRACLYWIHPNIPWMKLFPRICADSKSSLTVSPLLQDDIKKSLQTDWEQSFTSLFHQLRSGLCPYFYVCTHQLTVLFLREKKNQSEMVAMITPTTRGFRESLDEEGISFNLPLSTKVQTSDRESEASAGQETGSGTGQADTDNTIGEEGDDEDFLLEDGAAHGWLESMGLDKKHFPSLDPRKVKLQREGFRVIDHRPESLVMVEGGDVQALFNFLLNCRTCTAISGTQAGLPPTLLSPAPFKGATIKSHKVKHTTIKQNDKVGGVTHAHILEVSGPLLPSHIQLLVSLFHKTQKSDFGMVFNNSDPTVPFNILPSVMAPNVLGQTSQSVDQSKTTGSGSVLKQNGCRSSLEKRNSLSTSLETISEDEDSSSNRGSESLTGAEIDMCKSANLFRDIRISDQLSGLKEIVCTPKGFLWNS